MKKIIAYFLILLFVHRVSAQCNVNYDSLKTNEISVSFLPVLVLLSGYDPVGRYGSWNFGYKHFNKNKTVFRASVSFAPVWTFMSQYQRFLRHQDTVNVFTSNSARVRNKVQFNIGFEKVVRLKHFMHGLGAELFVRNQTYTYQNSVYWYPSYIDPGSAQAFDHYSTEKSFTGKIYNQIDSLSTSYEMKGLGLGLQLLYSIRYRINSRFYLSSAMGPYLAVVRYTYHHKTGNQDLHRSGSRTAFDAHIMLISDFSLGFRF